MAIRHTLIIAPVLLALVACETAQENPNYKYSSTYGNERVRPTLAQNGRHPDQQATVTPVRYVNTTPVQQSTQTIQTSHSTALPTTASNQVYTRVDSNCATHGINCQPTSLSPANQQAIITPAHSPSIQPNNAEPYLLATHQNGPVDNAFSAPISNDSYAPSLTENAYSADSVGTPGYEAVRQSLNADNTYASQTISQTAPQGPSQSVAFTSQPQTVALANQSVANNSAGFSNQSFVNTAPPILPVATPQDIPAWPQARTDLGTHYTIKAGDTVYSLSRSICSSVSAVQTLNNLDQNFSIKAGQTLQLPPSAC